MTGPMSEPGSQDLSSTTYRSRIGYIECRDLAVPHAQRALDRLIADYGAEAIDTPLARALEARAALAGTVVEEAAVPFGDVTGRMLRGSGRFVGAIHRGTYRKTS